MPTSQPPLQRGCFYHLHTRGNNRENLFVEARNYAYFMKLYGAHIEPVAETFAYCLMKNHVHFLIQVRDIEHTPAPSRCVANLLNAYTRAFNRAYGRVGALFQRPFGRIDVCDERYFAALVTYIHRNPQKHRFVDDFRDWPYSSYHALASARPTRVQRETVLAVFGGVEGFVAAHRRDVFDVGVVVADDDCDFDVKSDMFRKPVRSER